MQEREHSELDMLLVGILESQRFGNEFTTSSIPGLAGAAMAVPVS